MKKAGSLIIAVICIALMIGEWVWFFCLPTDSGSLGLVVFIPPMIIIGIVLFIVAIVHIVKFFKLLKMDEYLKAADPSYIPKELPVKKNYKALAGAVIQIAIITAIAIWHFCSTTAMIFSLPSIAIIIGLSLGTELCIRKFRGY